MVERLITQTSPLVAQIDPAIYELLKGGPMRRPLLYLSFVLIALALMAQDDSACDSDTGNGNGESAQEQKEPKKQDGCRTTASDDCTPHVGPNGKVRVDALVWSVTSAQTASTLGDPTYGLGEKADGVFVIVNVKVTSRKNESATLTDEAIQLEVSGGNTYKADSDGTVAVLGEGQDPLFLEDIGPDSTLQSKVVFDVPASVLNRKVEVRFNELGFGETHGYIRLPKPTPQ